MMQEFFNLTVEERDRLIAIHYKQKRIRETSQYIKQELDRINEQYRANQDDCQHPFAKKNHVKYEGYSEKPIYSTEFYCSDCDKRWTEEGSK
jgi:Spy/CpxP family protein refolding chaperone